MESAARARGGRHRRSGSREAWARLHWRDFYRGCGTAALTCRPFGDLAPDVLSLAAPLPSSRFVACANASTGPTDRSLDRQPLTADHTSFFQYTDESLPCGPRLFLRARGVKLPGGNCRALHRRDYFADRSRPQSILASSCLKIRSSLQRTSQQYIGVSTPLAGIILNPAPLLAARLEKS
jgi:hypothetical protein